MTESWIQSSEKILDRMKELEGSKEMDRLDHVKFMCLMIGALHRSLLGWARWVNNPSVMARFSAEELEEMNRNLSKFTRSFIEYDLEVTHKGAEKGPKTEARAEGTLGEETAHLYV
ncbi:MAG: DUF2153 family protein [Candidatus Bathyarchaeota archaeon]|nr:DUF2153 family protein [Candidatus Bathyarchaeota archaeon]